MATCIEYPSFHSPIYFPPSSHDLLYKRSKLASVEESASDFSAMTSATPHHHSSTPKIPSWWSRLSLDNWAWEIGASILCLCILAAIAGVLFGYNGRTVPDLPDGLTLNAIISFLATLAKATLMVVLAAAIRQEKWLWFVDEPRPLSTVDAFEEASRGPLGSLMLLLSRRGSIRAFVAATVTILTLGFEPFIQQLIVIDVRNVPIDSATASIRTPTSYNESVVGNLGGSSLSLNALIGAFGGATGAIPDPVCPSGNCTWPAYNTLAMCTVCQDMTNQTSLAGDMFNINLTSHLDRFSRSNGTPTTTTWTPRYSLPQGNAVDVSVTLDLTLGSSVQWFIDYPRRVVWPLNIDPSPNSGWTFSWDNSTYAGIPGPLFAMGYLDLDLGLSGDQASLAMHRATECAFTPCVRTMDTAVRGGQTASNTTATEHGRVVLDQHHADGTITSGWTARVNATDYSVLDHGSGDTQGRAYLLIQALRIALEGNTTYSYGGYWYPDPAQQAVDAFNYSATGFTQTAGPWSSAGQQAIDGADDFSAVVDGVGRALTGRFQQLQTSVALGTALRTEAIVVVRWAWLAYPLALVVSGLAGLLLTILSTHRHRMAVWKESTLPLLFRFMRPTTKTRAGTDSSGGAGLSAGEGEVFGHDPRRRKEQDHPSLTNPNDITTTPIPRPLTFSNAITTNKVSAIVTQAAGENVQLRRHDTFWVLDSECVDPDGGDKDNENNSGSGSRNKNGLSDTDWNRHV
ncbi:hypothetical protein A1O1_00700 [Capronia coronata CBS 617.96]|uniref:Uncharacterized protein n=1 Tax=Capronia coronata CBS 617.96 TaxID=1182541 RepID=W9YSR4_9EURO|nr:uncharacterized protein A1O1_00700 [Capronia coronata CBS 617.96]EXJ95578.1 hypothetical protein A1O1_00700 [Capronia coronata CBS 617.96]